MTAKRSNVVPFRRRPRPPLGPGKGSNCRARPSQASSDTGSPSTAAKMLRVMAGYLSSFGPPHPLPDVRHVAGAVAEAVDSDLALRGRSFAEVVTEKARRLMT